ncbi:hypothetical protein G6F48_013498 [Rhizopus delemar]|nr:hypothetical protein G6F48_013498 [Rhizopus delemar]
MPKSLAYETQMDIKSAIEHDVLTDVTAKRFGVHQNTVINHANKWMPNRIRKKGGKQHLVSDITLRLIKREIANDSLRTTKKIHLKLEELWHSMSFQSAVNVLHSVEIFVEIKKKKPLLAAQHKKARLAGAKKHQYWTIHDWRRIIFSNEAKINIWGSDGLKHGGGGIMLWGCITNEGPGYACQTRSGTMA